MITLSAIHQLTKRVFHGIPLYREKFCAIRLPNVLQSTILSTMFAKTITSVLLLAALTGTCTVRAGVISASWLEGTEVLVCAPVDIQQDSEHGVIWRDSSSSGFSGITLTFTGTGSSVAILWGSQWLVDLTQCGSLVAFDPELPAKPVLDSLLKPS